MCIAPSARQHTDAGAERALDLQTGWRPLGARAPSLFDISREQRSARLRSYAAATERISVC